MPEPPMMPRIAFVMISPLSLGESVAAFCDRSDVLAHPSFRGMRSMNPESRDSGLGPSGPLGMTAMLRGRGLQLGQHHSSQRLDRLEILRRDLMLRNREIELRFDR